MVSNQIIQHTLNGLQEITGVDFVVLDREANILAQTGSDDTDFKPLVDAFIESGDNHRLLIKKHFFKIFEGGELTFIVAADGASDETLQAGRIVVFQINSLLTAYRERYDKDDFIKNLLLDNLLLVDILNRTQKLHITVRARRVVFLVETVRERDTNIMETVRGLFPSGMRDFITAVDEKDIIVVRELNEEDTYENIDETAHILVDTLESEAMTGACVSYGTIVEDIKEVSRSYKEAKLALDVGRIFYSDHRVMAYSRLGIGRLIYQLPLPLCKMFIREIFGEDGPIHFDEEMLTTIDQFYANSLNVSKTSRELYIHRNTLVYRLEKLKNLTGLDILNFDDAITFQIALMVMKYMSYLETLDY